MTEYYLAYRDELGFAVRVANGGGIRNKQKALTLLSDRQANGEAFDGEFVAEHIPGTLWDEEIES